jgi:cell division protease FtsH
LGYTTQRPEGDRFLVTQSELESRIQVLLAGTVAEEVVFGDVSTGAQNDLERATDIARSMVMDYGMSRLGRVTYRHSRQTMLLDGQEGLHGDRAHSEQTAREIDEEIRRIVAQSLEGVRHVLETRRQALGAIADCLIEQETIDNADLKRIMEANSPSPMIVPGTEGAAPRPAAEEAAPRQARAEGAG